MNQPEMNYKKIEEIINRVVEEKMKEVKTPIEDLTNLLNEISFNVLGEDEEARTKKMGDKEKETKKLNKRPFLNKL